MTPQTFFTEFSASEVSEWGKYARYHDVHVTDSDYVVTYLDPTIYTAWCLYNTHKAVPWDYILKLKNWNYRVCYFQEATEFSEPLRKPITMGLTTDLFPDTPFAHRLIL